MIRGRLLQTCVPTVCLLTLFSTYSRSRVLQVTDVTFQDMRGGSGFVDGNVPFSFHDYRSSDGVAVSIMLERRGSSARAKAAMRRRVRSAIQIVARGAKKNTRGGTIGERVVGIFRGEDASKAEPAVLWTEGPDFRYIESPSLKHALLFEKQYIK